MRKLYYVHDPMCSWCWGFNKTWQQVEVVLKNQIEIEYLVGGLAPDSDQPMPADMQLMLQNTWQTIQQKIPGTVFNFDFWTKCKPRRSTYPACRAVLAAKLQNAEKEMTLAIQQAYYLNAQNPSNDETLESIARAIGLDHKPFAKDLNSRQIKAQLTEQITLGRSIGAQGFPSLILQEGDTADRIAIDYNSADKILQQIPG